METGALIMMIFGLGLTWGGAFLCLRLAVKGRNK